MADPHPGLDEEWRGRLPRPRHSLSSRGAIYHFHARNGSRSKGHSARAAAAYIQRAAEYSGEQGEEVAALEDPARRAEAERHLETIRWEEAARRRSQHQVPARGRGRDDDFNLER